MTLTIWDNTYFPAPSGNGPGLDAVDAAFEAAHPNVTIKHVGIPYDTFFNKLRAAIAAQSGPDVVTLYPGLFAAEYSQGLQPIDTILTDQVKKDVSLLDISAAPDGHTYSAPFTVYEFAYFTNKKLLAQAGITTGPATWDEFLNDCGKLRSAGVPGIASAWKDGYLADWYQYIYGDMLLDKQATADITGAKLPLNDPRMVKALTLLQDMDKAGCFADGGDGRVIGDMATEFKAGKAAMVLGVALPSDLADYQKALGVDNVGVLAPPMVPDSAYSSQLVDLGPNSGYAVTKWTPNSQTALDYVAFTLSEEAQTLMWTKSQQLPNNRNVKLTTTDPATQKIFDLLALPDNHTIYLALPASVSAVLEKQAADVVHGKTSASDAADAQEAAMARLRPRYLG